MAISDPKAPQRGKDIATRQGSLETFACRADTLSMKLPRIVATCVVPR